MLLDKIYSCIEVDNISLAKKLISKAPESFWEFRSEKQDLSNSIYDLIRAASSNYDFMNFVLQIGIDKKLKMIKGEWITIGFYQMAFLMPHETKSLIEKYKAVMEVDEELGIE